mgnify:CR=1 FL=1
MSCRLLRAMAACAVSGVRLGFAADVAELSEGDALDALDGLYARSLLIEVDRPARRYRLHPLLRDAAAPSTQLRERHVKLVKGHLGNWEQDPLRAAEMLEEAAQALSAPDVGSEWTRMSIAITAGNLAQALARLNEARDFYVWVEERADRTGNSDWLQASYGNQALILKAWGRLEEAMALHKKQEAICGELGDRAGLARSYANQGLISAARAGAERRWQRACRTGTPHVYRARDGQGDRARTRAARTLLAVTREQHYLQRVQRDVQIQ